MNKIKLAILLLSLPMQTFANTQLYIDNYNVLQNPEQTTPEIKDNIAYVPLNIITDLLQLNTTWEYPYMTITSETSTMTLAIGWNIAAINAEEYDMGTAAMYFKNHQLMVPLDIVAEVFEIDLYYTTTAIHITTASVYSGENKIEAIQTSQLVNLGYITTMNTNNICIAHIKTIIDAAKQEPTDFPLYYGAGTHVNIPNYYYFIKDYTFTGINAVELEKYEIYQKIDNGITTTQYIMRDTFNKQWYTISEQDYNLIETTTNLTDWITLSDTSNITYDDIEILHTGWN
ncbi:MAG: hypothetical protein BEN18_01995 [Epulopiscium sp. Nuni2H_MBin001]|nr:MAG: hypothetical protein BEN18_01995 [Epulopiscium sp. Nuni2H_MBin001]